MNLEGLAPSAENLILEVWGRGEIQYPPASLLLSFVSFHCNKSCFKLLELDVDPERECCQLHGAFRVGSCTEESALEWADLV